MLEYGVSQTVTILGLSLFILGYGIGPSEYPSRSCTSRSTRRRRRTARRREVTVSSTRPDLLYSHSVPVAPSGDAPPRPQRRVLARHLLFHALPGPHFKTDQLDVPPNLPVHHGLRRLAYPRDGRCVDGRPVHAEERAVRDGRVERRRRLRPNSRFVPPLSSSFSSSSPFPRLSHGPPSTLTFSAPSRAES